MTEPRAERGCDPALQDSRDKQRVVVMFDRQHGKTAAVGTAQDRYGMAAAPAILPGQAL